MRLLPKKRGPRVVAYLAIVLAYAALMWFVVFPYVDRTFVNRPAL